jgi:hypothetical protein
MLALKSRYARRAAKSSLSSPVLTPLTTLAPAIYMTADNLKIIT